MLAIFVDDFLLRFFSSILVLWVLLVTLLLNMAEKEKTLQVLHSQAREIVFRVYHFFKQGAESEAGACSSFAKFQARTTDACGVRVRQRISSEANASLKPPNPLFQVTGQAIYPQERST